MTALSQSQEIKVMLLSPLDERTEKVPDVLPSQTQDILASVSIDAEVRRVLYALATPEYLEAWLEMPEMERIECHPDCRAFDKFRIDLFSSGRRSGSIYASCHLSKPNRITYLWQEDESRAGDRSVVEMRLWAGRSKCSLSLRHSGFRNPQQREWHSAIWDRSLHKLRILIEGGGAVAEDANRDSEALQTQVLSTR
jgi:uncharacterized protein YndB with AHSA1/START domain